MSVEEERLDRLREFVTWMRARQQAAEERVEQLQSKESGGIPNRPSYLRTYVQIAAEWKQRADDVEILMNRLVRFYDG